MDISINKYKCAVLRSEPRPLRRLRTIVGESVPQWTNISPGQIDSFWIMLLLEYAPGGSLIDSLNIKYAHIHTLLWNWLIQFRLH